MNNKGSRWRGWLIAICLGIFYLSAVGRIPVSYWDEMIWVGRSYFVDYYLKGDFQNRVWQTIASYDQPKLGEYMYGLWIYPKYVYEKVFKKTGVADYPIYLIDRGLYQINEATFGEYKEYLKTKLPELVKIDHSDQGDRSYFQQKYGDKVLPTIDLVLYARKINIFWLILAVLMAYKIFKVGLGERYGTIAALLYGINSLVVTWGLKAHVEGLFLFFFNASLWLIYKYFQDKKMDTLLWTAIFIGLCTNAKLNGIMLGPIFAGAFFIWQGTKTKWKPLLFDSLVIGLVTVILVVLLNPYIQTDPVGKIGVLFEKRVFAAKIQSELFPEQVLSNPIQRISRMGVNFFSPNKLAQFNGIYGIESNQLWISLGLILVFGWGIVMATMESIKGNKWQQFMLLVSGGTVLTMSDYLLLDWDRYYILLVLPVIYFQILGTKELILKIINWLPGNYKKLGLVGGGLILGLFVMEIYLRVINYPLQSCKVINEASEYSTGKFDPILGWSYKENNSIEQDGIKYDFGEDGMRLNKETRRSFNRDTKNILVIGDSILFGHGIKASETFSEKLQDKLGDRYQVVNLSVQGYGTDQIFLRMMKLIGKYRPEIIITDYISDHNKRNVNEDRRYMFPCMKFSGTKPLFSVDNGNFKQISTPTEYSKYDRLKVYLVWKRYNEARKLKDWDYQTKLTGRLMRAMDELANINNIKLLTIDFDSEMTEYQKKGDYAKVVSVNNQDDKSLYISDGVHPNSKGTTVMLEKFWQKFGNEWF
jgi:lysophospholipase L1-like esterase